MFLKNNDIPNNDIFMYNAHNYFFLMPSLYSTVDAVQYSYLKQGDMFYYIMIALKKDNCQAGTKVGPPQLGSLTLDWAKNGLVS